MQKTAPDAAREEGIRKSLAFSLYDGIAYSVMFGMSDSFYQAFGIMLGATNIELGLIKTLPLTLGAFSQLLTGLFLARFRSRRRLVSLCAFLQALMFIPIILTAFAGSASTPLLIAFISLSGIFSMLLIPSWNSWMGDLVNEKSRGAYFGKRTSITGAVAFVSLVTAGFIMQQFKTSSFGTLAVFPDSVTGLFLQGSHSEFPGFVIIFMIAFFGRLISAYFLSRKYDPPYDYTEKKRISLGNFVTQSKISNVGTLILFMSILNFAFMMVAPYVDAFFLKGLKLNYLSFTFANATVLGVKYLFMPVWGKACDRYGARKVLTVGSMLVAVVPLFWIVGNSPLAVYLIQMFAGFSWSAFEMASLNFLFDATTPQNRASTIAVYSVANGLIGLAGSFASGFLIEHNNLFWSPYILIFVASGLIRLVVTLVFTPRLKEVRIVEHIAAPRLPLRVITMMAAQGVVTWLSIIGRMTRIKSGKISSKKKTDQSGPRRTF